MKLKKYLQQLKTAICVMTFAVFLAVPVFAAQDSMLSVTGMAQILPIEDGSGKYLLKSDGFYCLNANGSLDTKACVHYFDHVDIDGTILNGYYYHDESGQFRAQSSHVVYINNLLCTEAIDEEKSLIYVEKTFNGYYMVNNLGKLTAAPQVRYISGLSLNGKNFDGYYYFDEYGRMVTEGGAFYLDMSSHGQRFEGTYYFGGTDGVLVQEEGFTSEGIPLDENGRFFDLEEMGMDDLQARLEEMMDAYEGEWSVYVKDLNTEESFSINNKPLYSASLIKAFLMAKTYENMDEVLEHEAKKINAEPDSETVKVKVDDLLWNMITVSDNESCNELGRLQSETWDFLEGAEIVNEYLEEEGYEETSLQSTLHPSSSPEISLGEHNITTVEDCGLLLERIYKGECVSEEASEEMLELLLNQDNTTKIPTGISDEVKIANKTGETSVNQHDMAIVYGPKTTYILCVMSQDCPNGNTAIDNIRSISNLVYTYLNLYEYQAPDGAEQDLNEDPVSER